MYLGRIVELGSADLIYRRPAHPYTRALLESVPQLTLDEGERQPFRPIQGELPSPLDPPSGCAFHLRCPQALERCSRDVPPMCRLLDSRQAACWLQQS
jgi:oligopeptide/dipeptide ABC transporter ATP-binding protein